MAGKTRITRKRSKGLPVRAVCRNCGTATVGRFCHICGQDLFAGRHHRLRELVGDSLGTIFALDGKIFRTLKYLVAFPGRLTTEFYSGRIVRYVNPSKLFWFITIVFFALLWNTTDFHTDFLTNDETRIEIETDIKTDITTEAPPGEKPATPPRDQLEDLSQRYKMRQYLSTGAPYMVLTLVPVFALLVGLLFRRRERSYSDYLVFSLHFNSFVLLLLTVSLVVNKLFPGFEIWNRFAIWLPAVYLAVALHRVFRPRFVQLILRTLALMALYLTLMLTILVLFAIIFGILIN